MKALPFLIAFVTGFAMIGSAQEADPFGSPAATAPELTLAQKLRQFVIPRVEFHETMLEDALDFLRTRSVELDRNTLDDTKKGVNIVLKGEAPEKARLNLDLKDVPLGEALKMVARLSNLEMVVQESAVVIAPPGEVKQVMTPAMIAEKEEAVAEVQAKLDTITIPSIEFQDTPFPEALGFLAEEGFKRDPEKDETRKGVNIVMNAPPRDPPTRITLKLTDVSLGEAFRYTCSLAQMKVALEPDTIVISPVEEKE